MDKNFPFTISKMLATFIRLPSASSRSTEISEAIANTKPSHTVPLIPAGASFLRWVAPPRASEKKTRSSQELDDEGYGEIGSTGKTGRKITRDVSQKRDKDGNLEKMKKAKIEDEVDHYLVLGLSKWGADSTQHHIKTAYHRAILQYHPDKQTNRPASAGRLEEDPVFLAIQKAYSTLSDETKRRGYDSTFSFNDDVPSGREEFNEMTGKTFYSVYGPVFKRNSRFSEKKPVPQLGDKDTPAEGAWGFNGKLKIEKLKMRRERASRNGSTVIIVIVIFII